MRKLAVVLVVLAVMLGSTLVVSAQKPVVSTSMSLYNAPKGFFTQAYTVKKGETIQITVDVEVVSTSPAPLNGFWVYIQLKKPDGSTVDTWADLTSETVNIGEKRTYWINTGIKADQVGSWGAWVYLCMEKDLSSVLAYDSANFDVVEQIPQANITITDVAGVSVVGASLGSLAAAIYVLSRF